MISFLPIITRFLNSTSFPYRLHISPLFLLPLPSVLFALCLTLPPSYPPSFIPSLPYPLTLPSLPRLPSHPPSLPFSYSTSLTSSLPTSLPPTLSLSLSPPPFFFKAYEALVANARTIIGGKSPGGIGLGLSSDFIAGFCGETDDEHQVRTVLICSVLSCYVKLCHVLIV